MYVCVCACVELEDMEVGMTSKTSHLEDLRKKGGDEWLTILNADKAKVCVCGCVCVGVCVCVWEGW